MTRDGKKSLDIVDLGGIERSFDIDTITSQCQVIDLTAQFMPRYRHVLTPT